MRQIEGIVYPPVPIAYLWDGLEEKLIQVTTQCLKKKKWGDSRFSRNGLPADRRTRYAVVITIQ